MPPLNKELLKALITDGEWGAVEGHLARIFGDALKNEITMQVFFEVRKQKYRVALKKDDLVGAINILHNEIKVLSGAKEMKVSIRNLLLGSFDTDENGAETALVETLCKLYKLHRSSTNNLDLDFSLGEKGVTLILRKESDLGDKGVTSIPQKESNSWPEDLVCTLDHSAYVTSLDFHPNKIDLLLAGSSDGNICLWNLTIFEKMFERNYAGKAGEENQQVWVNRITWSVDKSSFFGAAFSTGMLHVYVLDQCEGGKVQEHWQVDAHAGGVNDLIFAKLDKELLCVSCGNDNAVKVWDVDKMINRQTLLKHNAPVSSVGFLYRGSKKHRSKKIASAATDGSFKLWDFDKKVPVLEYETSYRGATVMATSGDQNRVFLSGLYESGISHINKMKKVAMENGQTGKFSSRSYEGLKAQPAAIAGIDTFGSFLAAGDDGQIKVWHEDHSTVQTKICVDGKHAVLPESPALSFNSDHSLLAASTRDGKIVVLGSAKGLAQLNAQFLKSSF